MPKDETALAKKEEQQLAEYEKEVLAQENQVFPSQYNVIKINYDEELYPEHVGKFMQIKEGETEWEPIGDSFKAIILAKRHQYIQFSEDPAKRMKTSLFKEWSDEVTVYQGEESETVKGISHYIKNNFDDAKYSCLLYVQYADRVYIVRVKGASCGPLFDFQKTIPKGRTSFSYEVEIGHTKDKQGAVTFYPMTFKKTRDIEGEEYKEVLKASFVTSAALDAAESEAEYDQGQVVKDAEEVFNQ